MIGGTAGHDMDLFDLQEFFVRHAQFLDHDLVLPDPRAGGIRYCLGLLIHFFEHEMLVSGLFRRFRIPVDGNGLLFQFLRVHVVNMEAFRRQAHDLLIFNISHGSGITQDSGNVGSDKAAVRILPHNERAVLSYGKQLAGKIREQDPKRIGALHPVQHFGDGRHGISLIIIVQHMRQNFRIRLGNKMISPLDHFFLQRQIVFYDPIMDYGYGPFFIHMGMGVRVAWSAVRRPAGMADPRRSRHEGPVMGKLAQCLQPSHRLGDMYLLPVEYRHSGGIIPPVFQPCKAVKDDRGRLVFSDISNNSAHNYLHSAVWRHILP